MFFVKTLLLVTLCGYNVFAEPVCAYGASSAISIVKVATGTVVKTFKIKEYDGIFVDVSYQEDLIFYSSNKRIYRIHLLDDNGDRQITGTGQLFTNTNADHSEQFLVQMEYGVGDLQVDDIKKKVFFTVYNTIYEMDFDGKNTRKVLVAKSSIQSQYLYKDIFYFSAEGSSWKNHGIYRGKYDSKATVDCSKITCGTIFTPTSDDIWSIKVDADKLFFRIGNNINAIDLTLSGSSYPVKNPRAVLSDSQFVNGRGAQPLGVSGQYIVWNRKPSSSGQLLLGIMNTARTFISRKNIFLYGKESYAFFPRQISMFELQFPTLPPTKPTPKKCLCPCTKTGALNTAS